MVSETISGNCPSDGSDLLCVGGFSSDKYQTEAFTYYCMKCLSGYSYIRLLNDDKFSLVHWLPSGQSYIMHMDSIPLATYFRADLLDKCRSQLLREVAGIKKIQGRIPDYCPLDGSLMDPHAYNFQVLDTVAVAVKYCSRCSHFYFFPISNGINYRPIISISGDIANLNISSILPSVSADFALQCISIVRQLLSESDT